jgi:hypothetical protein
MTDSEGGGSGNPQQPPGSAPPPYSPPGSDQTDSAWGYQAPTPPSPYGSQGAQSPPPPPYAGQQAAPPPYGNQQPPPPYGQFGAPGNAPSARKLPNPKVMAIGGAAVAVVVVVIVVVVLVTGGSGNSPTNTANEFIQAVLSNNGAKICSLYIPSEQSACRQEEASFKGATGNGQVVNQAVQGDEALVSITGQLCAPYIGSGSNDCESNNNATAGMPGNGVSFDQAYSNATNPDTANLSPAPLQEVNGTWYVVP